MKKRLLFMTAILVLSGCSPHLDTQPVEADEPVGVEATVEPTPTGPLSVDEIAIPSLLNRCEAQTGIIERFDKDAFEEAFKTVESSDLESKTWREEWTLSSGLDNSERVSQSIWTDDVRGVALVATREFASTSQFEFVSDLENKSKYEFSKLVDRVLDSILVECNLQNSFLAIKARVAEGQVLLVERSTERQMANPPATDPSWKAADLTRQVWKSYGSIGDWRLGRDCSSSIGACSLVEVDFAKSCSSVFVEMNFLNSSGVYYSAIDSLRNVRAGQMATFKLQAIGRGTSVQLTKITCL